MFDGKGSQIKDFKSKLWFTQGRIRFCNKSMTFFIWRHFVRTSRNQNYRKIRCCKRCERTVQTGSVTSLSIEVKLIQTILIIKWDPNWNVCQTNNNIRLSRISTGMLHIHMFLRLCFIWYSLSHDGLLFTDLF
jgi:hypothetical protein